MRHKSEYLRRSAGAPSTNPHDQTKSTNIKLEMYLDRTPQNMRLSIYSTDLYQGVTIPVLRGGAHLEKILAQDFD